MKKSIGIFLGVLMIPIFVSAQVKIEGNITYNDLIHIDEVNGVNVLITDKYNQLVEKQLGQTQRTLDDATAHPKVYFTNAQGDKYLKVFGGPDLGYGWFYSIGYTTNGQCMDCGMYMGKDTVTDFVVNEGVKLGDDIKQVWKTAHLNYFRKFRFNGLVYYYYEKGIKHEVPFTPDQIYYFTFKDNKLIEIGLGYGMIGVNPMLHPE